MKSKILKRTNRNNGFSLTELMIAMMLGLFVIGGVVGVFLANQRTSNVNASLSELQNTARIAFQLMSKDIRSAGFKGCGNPTQLVNVLNSAEPWAVWNDGIQGFSSPVVAINGVTPTPGTEAIRLMYAGGTSNSVQLHDTANAQFTLTDSPVVNALDIAIVCDDTLSAIFQVSSIDAVNNFINHKVTAPLNCTENFRFANPFICAAAGPRNFGGNSMIMRFESVAWFVAPSADDAAVKSLYRATLLGSNQINEEVLYGVSDLQLRYMDATTRQFNLASAVINWGDIIAVSVTLTLDDAVLKNLDVPDDVKNINFLVTIRNRVN